MQSLNFDFQNRLKQLSKNPVYLVEFNFKGKKYRFSNANIKSASASYREYLNSVEGNGSQTTVVEGTTSISGATFKLIDTNRYVTNMIFNNTLPNAPVTIKIGFENMIEDYYEYIFVGKVLNFTLESDNVTWRFDLLPRWALAVLAARELLMLALGRYGIKRGVELRINWPGRLAVAPVMGSFFFAMTGLEGLGEALLYIGLALALSATALYARSGLRRLRADPRS